MLADSADERTAQQEEQEQPAPKRPRKTVPDRPPCAVALKDALLTLFKKGFVRLTLDALMSKLQDMPKLAAGLSRRTTVARALVWLAQDETPILAYSPSSCQVTSLIG